jgi:hypothetical protein
VSQVSQAKGRFGHGDACFHRAADRVAVASRFNDRFSPIADGLKSAIGAVAMLGRPVPARARQAFITASLATSPVEIGRSVSRSTPPDAAPATLYDYLPNTHVSLKIRSQV